MTKHLRPATRGAKRRANAASRTALPVITVNG